MLLSVSSFALIGSLSETQSSILKMIFGNQVFAYIGRISYSVYLWHWPFHFWTLDLEWLNIECMTFN